MKSGYPLDLEIAKKVMKLKITDKVDIPPYSTNTVRSHDVISVMQKQGWSFHVRSKITQNGSLLYRARFVLGNKQTEKYAPTLPFAICLAALMVVDNQYFEYVEDEEDERPIEIVGNSTAEPILKNIDISEEPLEELLARQLIDFKLPSENGLTFGDILTEGDLRKLPSALLKFFVDILDENNYCISKKIDD